MKYHGKLKGVLRLACGALIAVLAVGMQEIAHAQTVSAPPVARSEVGHATTAWLDLQRGNSQAAPEQPMLGEEAGLAYRRYMESFKSKIPDLYGSAINQGSGGGQGGGMSGQLPQN
ncbi:DUF3613 domain-containing protein [Paraburkholderia nemoris]|uniref:DUF3613 domain-containing protein n=1 Tax=Paraburkholderia nemoris TaxID=2793076 RepID=UPI0006B64E7E|nr:MULTISPECIES: DUF3613 domain-containing protein [Paraburkholderia]KPD19725.1 hypothetical protein ADM96_04765 [Burkholderia sp. ST111]MBK3783654.1 DUF3613 domain-containing protein [Paraburkholderia aspalathi]CAE6709291.1 hypothetical protein R75777_01070 [Paraburkholderia nemoris]CAE6800516.1 hypothetical protein R75461_05163 [Paraburkholderia nemoris]